MVSKMTDKPIRLVKALWQESVSRLPYILLVLGILFLVQFIKLNTKTTANTQALKANTIQLQRSVNDIKRDNAHQTSILCRLILKGTVGSKLNPQEATQVENICKEAISPDAPVVLPPTVSSSTTNTLPGATTQPNSISQQTLPETSRTPPPSTDSSNPLPTEPFTPITNIQNFVNGIINGLKPRGL